MKVNVKRIPSDGEQLQGSEFVDEEAQRLAIEQSKGLKS